MIEHDGATVILHDGIVVAASVDTCGLKFYSFVKAKALELGAARVPNYNPRLHTYTLNIQGKPSVFEKITVPRIR